MKDCKKTHPLLPLYLDGSLSPREAARVEAHLKDCADARRELDELKRLREIMVALPEPKLPHDLHQRIMARVQGRPLPRRPFWVLPAGAMAVAAVVAVALFVQNPGLMDLNNRKESRFSAEQSGTLAANKASTQAAGYIPAQPKPTEPGAQAYSYAPNQPQMADAESAKDQKAKMGPTVQLASMPRAKESRAAKKVGGMELAMDKTSPAVEKPGLQAQGASPANPSSDLAFSGSNTLAPASKNEAVNAALPSSNANLSGAPAPAAVPAEAPPAEAPTPITSWSGSFNPASSETQELVTDAVTFQKYWQSFQPGQTPPAVDFTAQAVVVLMDQERPTAGYSIHITSLEEKPGQITVHYRVQAPPAGSFTAQVLTRPWALQIIPKPTKPVVFQKD